MTQSFRSHLPKENRWSLKVGGRDLQGTGGGKQATMPSFWKIGMGRKEQKCLSSSVQLVVLLDCLPLSVCPVCLIVLFLSL